MIDRWGKSLSSPYVLVLVLLVLATLVRLVGIGDAALRTDEIYHLLAGRSWADHGTLQMGDGVYTRARFYSMATGWFFELFGPTPGVGRGLAAVGGILLILATALWVRKTCGPIAAWVAGLLLCFSYSSITIAQFARFYTWHALGVFLLAIATYAIVTRGLGLGVARLGLWIAVALAAFVVSLHLQDITLLVVLALATWVGLHLLLTGKLAFLFSSPVRLAGLAILVLLALAVIWVERHRALHMWYNLRSAAAWSHENQDNFGFYITVLGRWLSWLFYLLPVAAIIAWRRYRDVTLFCVTMLAVCLALHSLAGMKALRYVYYLYPYIFTLWGCAVAVAGPPVVRFLHGLVSSWAGRAAPAVVGGLILVVTAVSFVIIFDYRLTVTGAVRLLRTGSVAQPFEYGSAREEVDWEPHLAPLRVLQNRGLFIATDSVRTLYYLQDYDLLLNKTELSDAGPKEFTYDRRTGKRDISTGQSVEAVVKCYPSGAIIVSDARWRNANVPEDAANMIERIAKPVKLPEGLRMRGYVWEHAMDSSPDCARLHALIGEKP
jgi:hypothetical protein